MLVVEGLLPFLSPALLAQTSSSARLQHERRPDPLRRPDQHAGRPGDAAGLLDLSRSASDRLRERAAGTMPFLIPGVFACPLLGSCPSTSPMSCPPRRGASKSCAAACSTLRAGYGFELVMPPLLEHLESLLSGTGHDARSADLQARRPAERPHARRARRHARRRSRASTRTCSTAAASTRLCYCGPVLHTRPAGLHATREPLQFGAEIYGHAGLEADLEIQRPGARLPAASPACRALALDLGRRAHRARRARRRAGRCRRGSTRCMPRWRPRTPPTLRDAGQRLAGRGARAACSALLTLYGGAEVLDDARARAAGARRDRRRARRAGAARRPCCRRRSPRSQIGFDLADLSGYAYYSGARFAVYADGRERRGRARRPLRRGRRGLRPHPAGGRLQPRPEGTGRARAAGGAPKPRSARRGASDAALRGAMRAAARAAARSWSASCPGHERRGAGLRLRPRAGRARRQWLCARSDADTLAHGLDACSRRSNTERAAATSSSSAPSGATKARARSSTG